MSTKANGKKLKMLPGRGVKAINGLFSTTCGHISYNHLEPIIQNKLLSIKSASSITTQIEFDTICINNRHAIFHASAILFKRRIICKAITANTFYFAPEGFVFK